MQSLEIPTVPESPKLRAIAEACAVSLLCLFADHEDDINEALVESQDGKTTLSHSITLDLGKNKLANKLSFSVKHGDVIEQAIPNPDQPALF